MIVSFLPHGLRADDEPPSRCQVSRVAEESMLHANTHELIGLYRAAESRAARMRLLLRAGRDLAMADTIDVAAGRVLQHAIDFSGFRAGYLLLRDEDDGRLRLRATSGQGGEQVDACCDGDELLRIATEPGQVLLWFGEGHRDGVSGALLLSAASAIPSLDDEDRETLGLLLANFSAMVRIARQNDERARLHAMLKAREAHLDDLVGRLISTQEDERKRLSIELHDGLAQVISSAHQHLQAFSERCEPMDAEALPLLDAALNLIRRAASETRMMMVDLRPTLLDDFGIGKAIEHLVADLYGDCRDCRVENALGAVRLSPDVETALFRVAQEALRNAARHAPGARVVLSMGVEAGDVRLVVRDDGPGFLADLPGRMQARGERLGLLGMQERMRRVGGSCRVESLPGRGTTIQAWAPMPMPGRGGVDA